VSPKEEHKKTARKQLLAALSLLAVLIAVHLTIALLPKDTPKEIAVTSEEEIQQEEIRKPIPFDPNKADSLTLLYNGLKPWQIKNLMKYRAKGGRYRSSEDFRKLYGLTDSAFLTLRPYIRIDSSEWIARRDSLNALRHERDSLRHLADSLRRDSLFGKVYRHPKCDTIIELNSADTSDLQYIRGIGPSYARQIIRQRHLLGGYVSPEQIREIEGLKLLDFDSIIPHLTANPDSVHPMRVNYYSVEKLKNHPYLTFTQAKAIYTLRRNKLKLRSMEELRQLDCLSDSLLQKLSPYLSFEP